MNFVVSARKYRPKDFGEVVGQEHVTDTLKNIIANKKLAHAYLFTGPRGVGKTTCARIFARAINCTNFVEGKICGECDSCKSFDSNASFNILELDAASNNSVENIRNLTDQVRFKPQKGQYKVFIIDEVHMLSPAAFNAFLKTLEEPPDYAIFILATTEKHKIIPTILSRCQIYDFHRIDIRKIIEQLKNIAALENITAEEDALFLVAEKADGALRDALSLFDRLSSASNGNITYDKTVDNLFILDHEYYFKLSDAILREDPTEIFNLFDDVLKKGFQGDQLINGLSMHYRNLLLSKDPKTYQLVEGSEELKKRYVDQAQLFNSAQLMTAIDISNQCDITYQRAQNKRLHVEIALLKQCYIGKASASISVDAQKKKLAPQPKPTSSPITTTSTKSQLASKPIEQEEEVKTISSDESIKTEDLKENVVVDEATTESEEKVVQAAKPKEVASQKASTLKLTPGIGSVDAILAKIKSDASENSGEEKELTNDEVKTCWNALAEELQSPSLKAVLNKAILSLVEDRKLNVSVPNNVSRDLISQEKALLQRLRTQLKTNNLEISIQVDRSLFPEVEEIKKTTILTSQEKYKLLLNENPMLDNFVKKFNLKSIE